jgi:RNA polymerase sigma-70 factor, ECF subfamily
MDPVKAARKGSEEAFLRLFDEHHLPLFRFAWRMTGSAADAEEIVQDCFLSLLQQECRYDAKRTPLRTYLFGAVRNQALKRLRNREDSCASSSEPVDERSPESEMRQRELAEAVARALGQLPETQREVLILAHYEQIALAEIASIVAIEVGAVKSRLQRARAAMKEMLAAYAPGAERNR